MVCQGALSEYLEVLDKVYLGCASEQAYMGLQHKQVVVSQQMVTSIPTASVSCPVKIAMLGIQSMRAPLR